MTNTQKTCGTCSNRDRNGYCLSPKIQEDYDQPPEECQDMLLYGYNEGGSFWVGEQFGCIHHVAK